MLSGNEKDYEADYLFATMQMLAKPETLQRFTREQFQIIVIEEAHRIGAASYQNIMEYFRPELWLGMTASPERTDDFDVYQVFDHNIAYEIRLQQALEEYCGDRVRGLVFCSSKKEAFVLSEKFNERGYRTISLTGEDKNEIIDIMMDHAQTGETGNSGDGKSFVVPVEESYTISSSSKDDK